ncbi:unnamed protein product [Caenorhabditis sp. 36 PRJEB53466]|nr:unnamed protein product [Caenorhabditis sp. 36 PRJEB53466]
MFSLEQHADLMSFLCAAATATVAGVGLSVLCTTGQRENTRGKRDKSMRSQRGKKNASQRSLRKKKPQPLPMKEAVKEKSLRSKKKDASARSKVQVESKKQEPEKSVVPKKESSKREKKGDPMKELGTNDEKTEKPLMPLSLLPPPITPISPSALEKLDPTSTTPPAAQTAPANVPAPAPASPTPKQSPVAEEKKPEVVEASNVVAVGGEEKAPESVMIDNHEGASQMKEANRLYGASGEAAVAEAKKQVAMEKENAKEQPKEEPAPGDSQYL